MGGTSTQQQSQSSTTAPWQAAQPALTGILGQLGTNLNNTGVTGAENGALGTLEQNGANATSQYAPAVQNYATGLLNGGGALNQAGAVNQNYQDYYKATNPLASNTNYNPLDTPGFKDALTTQIADITNGVNGSFAAAGRDFSGANSQALGRGIMQGVAPTIAAQYNQNVNNQQGAAGNLYGAGNTNAGILSGFQQQYLANQGQGVGVAGAATDIANAGANATLQAEAARRGIPVQALGLLANIGTPIAGLGGQSTGQSSGSQTMSGAQQFGTIANGIGSAAGGIGNFFKFMPSDRALKEDVSQVGTLFDGTPVYGYRYKGSPAYQIGLMAQDVEQTTPEAVEEVGGYKAVDYHAATERSRKIAEAA